MPAQTKQFELCELYQARQSATQVSRRRSAGSGNSSKDAADRRRLVKKNGKILVNIASGDEYKRVSNHMATLLGICKFYHNRYTAHLIKNTKLIKDLLKKTKSLKI